MDQNGCISIFGQMNLPLSFMYKIGRVQPAKVITHLAAPVAASRQAPKIQHSVAFLSKAAKLFCIGHHSSNKMLPIYHPFTALS